MKAHILSTSLMLINLLIILTECKEQNVSGSRFFQNFLSNNFNSTADKSEENSLLNIIVLDLIPRFLGCPPVPFDQIDERERELALSDNSNDEIVTATSQEILTRSGFKYENYYSLADDGYITQLIRIVNPLANRKKLKQPPVLLFHGGAANPTLYIWASAIQHHPEPYPRLPERDGPMTSSNRSLGFMLANNGYDVWLIETRGSDPNNREKDYLKAAKNFAAEGGNEGKNMTKAEGFNQVLESPSYWSFSFDNIIEHEFENQVDRVREITGSKKVTIYAYSYSTLISLPKFGLDREFVEKKVHNYIVQAPIINNKGAGEFFNSLCDLVLKVPLSIGIPLVDGILLTQPVRTLFSNTCRNKSFCYTFMKLLVTVFVGSSGKYKTFLELPVLGHVAESFSFMQGKHHCQQVTSSQMQKYDFGYVKNKLVYGQEKPPVYNISNIHVKNWLLISGAKDNLATPASVRQILETVNPKPYKHISISDYNHIDPLAGMGNDVKINLPILKFLNKFQLKPNRIKSMLKNQIEINPSRG